MGLVHSELMLFSTVKVPCKEPLTDTTDTGAAMTTPAFTQDSQAVTTHADQSSSGLRTGCAFAAAQKPRSGLCYGWLRSLRPLQG